MCREFLGYTAEDRIKEEVIERVGKLVGDRGKARECVECLETVYGILEQSNYILKGDLHSHSLHKIEEFWKGIVGKYNKSGGKSFDEREMF